MGYQVIRALQQFHTNDIEMQLSEMVPGKFLEDDFMERTTDHLKVSVATNSNISWAKTFEFETSEFRSKLKIISKRLNYYILN